LITDTPVAETEYTDENLAGGTYSYEISALYSTGESALAGPIDAVVATIVAPENLSASVESLNNIELTWNAIDVEGFSHYNVYRDGAMVNEAPVTENMYIDYDVNIAEYEYYVVAVYEAGCVSESSNVVEVIDVNVEDLENAIKVYPNPAKGMVNIEVSNTVESIRIMNYVGQQVYSHTVLGQDVVNIDTQNYEAGSYIVQFVTNDGEVMNKRLVVVK
jgi:hypothetical protein